MATKMLKSKLGSNSSDLEKLKKENETLKKTLEEMSKSKEKSDAQRKEMLELETLKEHCSQEIAETREEIDSQTEELRYSSKENDPFHVIDASKAEQIADDIQNQLSAALIRINYIAYCLQQESEDTKKVESANNLNILESQLKDALEKNQKWLVYDQQREEYVKGLMGRIYELEQQLGNANKTIQQQGKDTPSEAKQDDDKQKHYDKLLLAAKKDLDNERKITAQLSAQLSAMKAERDGERRAYKERKQKLRAELEVSKQKIEEEKQRTIALTNQIQAISVSLLKQHEQQSRIAALEQQKNTSDIFNNVPSCTFHNDFEEKLTIRSQRSPPHRRSLLDESFLECPNCKAMYPASQHRELLAHIDFCTS
ncbi:centrosomal protein of 55 kDa isoform X2 [Xenopus laevis]|uniref:Centrosomal protein of 55 kDa n=1 Tax=Xenopus laevis TaxID=8355 RepID=A0A8J1L6V6_XENLA|nr:centrosomal protein of 55 kDa isoform X2 [Xenopus laevis]